MLKRLILILILFLLSPVYAGVLENAVKDNDYVFLYLYTNNCGYCKKFNPYYEQAVKKHSKNCKFLKVDADSGYGYNLMKKFRSFYVPFVVLIDTKASKSAHIPGECLLSSVCLDKVVTGFTSK